MFIDQIFQLSDKDCFGCSWELVGGQPAVQRKTLYHSVSSASIPASLHLAAVVNSLVVSKVSKANC